MARTMEHPTVHVCFDIPVLFTYSMTYIQWGILWLAQCAECRGMSHITYAMGQILQRLSRGAAHGAVCYGATHGAHHGTP